MKPAGICLQMYDFVIVFPCQEMKLNHKQSAKFKTDIHGI